VVVVGERAIHVEDVRGIVDQPPNRHASDANVLRTQRSRQRSTQSGRTVRSSDTGRSSLHHHVPLLVLTGRVDSAAVDDAV
jgi:hypothetical protein